jgi:RHS repeat-associated protein
MGNRVWKKSTVAGQTTCRKYIVDIASGLPTILMEVDPCTGSLTKAYIYANGEILVQHNGDDCMANRCFYLHDRLGNVRQVISYDNNLVLNSYTYGPFGQTVEQSSSGTVTNSFMFTGQYYDSEIGQYYLRARQYDPQLMRFTARDPIIGKFEEPLTLHKYLYCINDSLNCVDPSGALLDSLLATAEGAYDDAMDAGAAMKVLLKSKNAISAMESVFNGCVEGWLNVLDGPQGVSDIALFDVGFAAGIVEIQVAEKSHSASVGAAVSSAMINTADLYLSGTGPISSKEAFEKVLDVGFSAGVAALTSKTTCSGKQLKFIEQEMVGIYATTTAYLSKYLFGDKK